MNKTKRILAMLLALTMLLCAAACTASEDDDKNSKREKRTEEIKEENEFEADEQTFDFEEYGEATGVHRDFDEALELYLSAISNKDVKAAYELTVPIGDAEKAMKSLCDFIDLINEEYNRNLKVNVSDMFSEVPENADYMMYLNKIEGSYTEFLRILCSGHLEGGSALGEFWVEAYNMDEFGWRFIMR